MALLAIQGHRPAPPVDKDDRVGGDIQAATSPDHQDPQPDCQRCQRTKDDDGNRLPLE